MDGFPIIIRTTHALHTIASEVIVTDAAHSGAQWRTAARSGAHVFQDPADINRKYTGRIIPRNVNTYIRLPRLTSPVLIGGGNTVSPNRTGSQEISSSRGPTGPVEVRKAQIFHTSVNGYSAKNGDPNPTFSKLIRRKLSDDSSADI